MKIQIINETGIGNDTDTRVLETNEHLRLVSGVKIDISIDSVVSAELTFALMPINIIAEARLSKKTREEIEKIKNLCDHILKTGDLSKMSDSAMIELHHDGRLHD